MANQGSTPKIVTKKHIARLERERRQVRLIRWIAVGGIIIVALLLVYGYLDLNYLRLREPVAEVNGEVVTIGEWQERVQFQRVNLLNLYNTYQVYQQNFGLDTTQQQQEIVNLLQSPDTLGQQVLDQMVDEALIRQEAEKRGITASQEEIDKAIQELYGFFPNGTATPTITPTEFIFPTLSSEQLAFFPATSTPTTGPTSTIAPSNTPDTAMTATATFTAAPPTPTFVPEAATATATPYTLEGFNEQYAKALEDFKTNGISEGTLRSLYTTNILRDKLLKELLAGGPQTEEQVWARHILVEDERSLGIVRSLLASGRDFGEVARKYSVDTGSGANGGDLGWFGRGAMVPEFEEAAFSQEIGEIGEPIKSQFGYHIIQVIAHQELPVAQSQQSQDNALSEWVVKAREESTITINEAWREQIPPLPAAFGQAQPN